MTPRSEYDQEIDHTPNSVHAFHEEVRAIVREAIHQFRREIRRSVDALKIEVFFKTEIYGDVMMIDDNHTDSSINISGGSTVGAIAQSGAVQIIRGSITQHITSLQNNPETKPGADALKQLADAIAVSEEIPSERERKRHLEDIEELTVQAARPKADREKGVFGPIIDRLMGLCGGAGGLAAVWAVAGPTITALFS